MHRNRLAVFLVAVLGVACAKEDDSAVRGRGYKVAPLSAVVRARVAKAALGAAFDTTDPALVVMLPPLMLPKKLDAEGDSVRDDFRAALLQAGVAQGVCVPDRDPKRKIPRCPKADAPGYLARFSDVFTMRGDTVLVYMDIERYDIPSNPAPEVIHFENAYKVVKTNNQWKAAQEGRVPKR